MRKGQGIKEFRLRLGIKTQAEFAKILNVHQTSVSSWERGKGNPSFEEAKRLLDMGATVEELFGLDYKVGDLDKGKGVLDKFEDLERRVARLESGRECVG